MTYFRSCLLNQTFILAAAALAVTGIGKADVSLIVEEAVGGAGEFTGSGHSAVYFSNLCAESPTKLRRCAEGEEGAVISTYPEIGAKASLKWMAIPLTPFLYGVDALQDVPLYGNGKVRRALRESYRGKRLDGVIPVAATGTFPAGRWSEMIGTAINRDVYLLTVKTSPEQDQKFLVDFDKLPNVNDFGTMYNNCADFARDVLNMVFPHATHRDVINDFTMTTPKAIAHSFTRYAKARPELNFRVSKYSQVDGAIRRSLDNRNFTEKAIVSKKYFLTMAFTKPELLPIFGGAYLLTGWYNLESQYKSFGAPLITSTNPETGTANAHPSGSRLLAINRTTQWGTESEWAEYRTKFRPMLSSAIEAGLFRDREEVKTFFKDLEVQSKPGFDRDGSLLLDVDEFGTRRLVGVTRRNLTAQWSDPRLAYKIMLTKVNYMLQAPKRNRPSFPEFQGNWDLLQTIASAVPRDSGVKVDASELPRFRQTTEVVPASKRAQKLLMQITH